MLELPDPLRARQGDRLYPHLRDVLIYYATVERAMSTISEMPPMPPDGYATMRSAVMNVELIFQLYRVFDLASRDFEPEEIELPFRRTMQPISVEFQTTVLNTVSTNLAAAIFALSCEEPLDWLRVRWDVPRWPPVASFCRFVRNAVAHGGKISADNPNGPSASWHSLNYSPADNGREIIGKDLSFADLLLLMCELDREVCALQNDTP